MVKVAFETEIAGNIEDCFDLWADMRNDVRWNPIAENVDLVSDHSTGVGASFRGRYRGFGDVVETVSTSERPHRCARDGDAGRFRVKNDIRWSVENGKTVMRFSGEVVPTGIAVLMTPLMGIMMRRQAQKTVAAFKQAIESGMTSLAR